MLSRYESNDLNTEKLDYSELISQLDSIAGFEKHNLRDSAGGLPTYGYSIGSKDKPTIVIDGSIHNYHEWKSAHGVMELMRVLSDPSLWAAESALVRHFKSRYRFYFVPVVSPDSYFKGQRTNDNGVALDYNFPHENWSPETDGVNSGTGGTAPFSEPETKNIRDIILGEGTVVYINMHTVGSKDRLIMARYNINKVAHDALLTSLRDSMSTYPDYQKPYVWANYNKLSSSYNWAGVQDGEYTDKIIGVVIEPGSGLELPQNKNITVYSIFTFLKEVDSRVSFKSEVRKENRFFKSYYAYNIKER